MLGKIAKLFKDNRLKDLISGNMVIPEEVINEFANRMEIIPDMERMMIRIGDGHARVDVTGKTEGVNFNIKAGLELKGLSINSDEQVFQVMPHGAINITTDNQELLINFKNGPALLDEWNSLLKMAPEDQIEGISIEEEAVKISLHENPEMAKEFKKAMDEVPLAREFGINILDYVEIKDVRFEQGAVRILAKRR
jgi:hypothetical protein